MADLRRPGQRIDAVEFMGGAADDPETVGGAAAGDDAAFAQLRRCQIGAIPRGREKIPGEIGGVIDPERFVDRRAVGRVCISGTGAGIIVVADVRREQITGADGARENIEIGRAQRLEGRAGRVVVEKIIVAGLERLAETAPDGNVSRIRPGCGNAQAQRDHADRFLQSTTVLSGTPSRHTVHSSRPRSGTMTISPGLQSEIIDRPRARLECLVIKHQDVVVAIDLAMDLNAPAGRERTHAAGERNGLRDRDGRLERIWPRLEDLAGNVDARLDFRALGRIDRGERHGDVEPLGIIFLQARAQQIFERLRCNSRRLDVPGQRKRNHAIRARRPPAGRAWDPARRKSAACRRAAAARFARMHWSHSRRQTPPGPRARASPSPTPRYDGILSIQFTPDRVAINRPGPRCQLRQDFQRFPAIYRKNTKVSFVLNHLVHQLAGDAIGARRVAVDQGRIAQNVDHAGNAVAGIRNHLAGLVGEQMNARAGRAQAEADVIADLVAAQGFEMKVRRDALGELQKFRAEQRFLELGLPDEDRLQELMLVDIDVREHAQAFERALAQVLRFVDDQDGAAPVSDAGCRESPEEF